MGHLKEQAIEENKVMECDFAKSDMTPCYKRDGSLALANDGTCVGCGRIPDSIAKEARKR